MSNVIPFPNRSAIAALPDLPTEIDEARHMVAKLRAQRDACEIGSRAFAVEQIKLGWWSDELSRLIAGVQGSVIRLRTA